MFTKADFKVMTKDGKDISITRSDGAYVPICPGNRDYEEFLKIDGTGVCKREPIPAPTSSGPTDHDLLLALTKIVEAMA